MELTCHRSEEEAWVRLIGAQSCLQFPQRTLSLIPVQWIGLACVCLIGIPNAAILDFDVDITGPHCIIPWRWQNDLILQMCLPIFVRLRHSPRRPAQAPLYILKLTQILVQDE